MRPFVLALCCLLLVQRGRALVDVAKDRPYYINPEGFTELVFQSHNNQGYVHTAVYGVTPGLLTLGLPISASSPMWTNSSADFNVTITVSLGAPVVIREVLVSGPCCNMGVYTPIAAYAYGADSSEGPWTFLGESTGLVSGDDTETPAVRYEMHFVCHPDAGTWSYVRLLVTGAADKYMSIRKIQILA